MTSLQSRRVRTDLTTVARLTPVRRASAPAVALCLAVAATTGVGELALSSPAHAVTVPSRNGVAAASAKVRAVEQHLRAIGERVAAAEKRYEAALGTVADSVTAAISADRNRSEVQALVVSSKQRLDQQIAGLYASGGDLAATESLLSPTGILAYNQSSQAVSNAVNQTMATARQQRAIATAATQQVSRTSRRAGRSIATARSVANVAFRVTRLLTREQAILTAAQQQLAHQKALAAAAAALAAQTSTFAGATTVGVNAVGVLPPSASYLALYRHAATTCPGLSWTILAAIGQVESGHGRNDGPSSAGAEGPMQFEPATFARYAVDGNHDGSVDINDPADAIFTAAHYLCANGAGRGGSALDNAIFDYNHAAWYVDLVLTLAGKYTTTYRH